MIKRGPAAGGKPQGYEAGPRPGRGSEVRRGNDHCVRARFGTAGCRVAIGLGAEQEIVATLESAKN